MLKWLIIILMVLTMVRKKTALLCVIFVSLLVVLKAAPVSAHAPGSVTLDYDFDTQVLTVQVAHSVANVNTHYIIQIIVLKNSIEFTTRAYSFQDSTSGMSDTFDVPAVDGDVLRVTAICNGFGEWVSTVTVSDPSITTTTTTSGTTGTTGTTTPTSPTGMDSTTVAIFAAGIGIGIILLVVVFVKRR